MGKMHTLKWYKENFGVSPLALGLPFVEKKNPYYASSPMMKLWDEDVVLPYRSQTGIDKHKARREAAKKAAEIKKAKLMVELQTWKIYIKSKPLSVVRNNAIREYNEFHQSLDWIDYFKPASLDSDREFLDRITVNHIRHQLSNYERRLEQLFGKVGVREAYPVLKVKILDAIASSYPELSGECKRQSQEHDSNQEL